jgi:DNA mismatch repair protein MutS2
VDQHSLTLLEFGRVTGSIAERAACDAARDRLRAWRPIADAARRGVECHALREAIARTTEPGEWCATGERDVGGWLGESHEFPADGPALVAVRGWLEAGRTTRSAWEDEALAGRYPDLASRARDLPQRAALLERLEAALDPDGRVMDAASPALARARREHAHDERALEQRMTSWAKAHGEEAHVTRHADRFVALIPAAGFARRRGIVHDVSGSGQSLYVEPVELCEANNQLIELRARVAEEEQRVLAELAAEVWRERDALAGLIEALVQLDTLRARARWAREVGARALEPGGDRLRLRAARHPLLAMARGGAEAPPPGSANAGGGAVVPLDLELGEGGRLLLVSGPNMGGKSVLLKTVGLAAALAHAALPVPAAEGSALPELDQVLVDLGDEQSVDQGLSTFAAHLRRLAAMAGEASPRTLLLVDELGAGTDPEEGGSLGRALVEHFAACGAWGVMTTHLGSLKLVASEVRGVVNGSMEFDLETLTPRFRFIAGIPGASHALSVAERMGFPPALIERARQRTSSETRALERLVADLQSARDQLERERESARAAAEQATAAAAEHRRAAEESRVTLEELRRRLTRESEAVLARARELWQTVQREARRADKTRDAAGELKSALEASERAVSELHSQLDAVAPPHTRAALGAEAIAPGRRVRVTDLGVEADVVNAPDAEGKVVLQRGSWTIHSHVSRLAAAAEAGATATARGGASWQPAEEAPALEIDVRGMEVDEALRNVDQGLDRAVLAGLSELRIIHGIGKGILRAAVERHLHAHPLVQRARLGEIHEGGRGATVAQLR